MFSQDPSVRQLVHHERVARLTEDAQHPMSWTSIPSFGIDRAVARLAQVVHLGVAVRHRRIYSKP
jgi:hypothetical protein